MKLKKIAMVTLALALTAGSAMTSLAAGWEEVGDSNWKYLFTDGEYAQNQWVMDKDNWYYIGGDNLMKTGWLNVDGKKYFMADSGEMISGLIKVDGKVYYMDGNSGEVIDCVRFYDNIPYHFTTDGVDADKAPYIYEEWSSNGVRKTATKVKTINYNRGY